MLPVDPDEVLDPNPARTSNFRLELTISVGYSRERAGHMVTGKWEPTITSLFLLIGGIALVLLVVYEVLSRL
ncbi:MAG TPA: hypothetical protein VFB50_04150 [Chloroflexota bacterium]|nr:hypothetical protein [Chloroflexota bacterium]